MNRPERYQAEMVVFRSNQYLTEKDEYKETPWTLRMRSFHHMHRLDATDDRQYF